MKIVGRRSIGIYKFFRFQYSVVKGSLGLLIGFYIIVSLADITFSNQDNLSHLIFKFLAWGTLVVLCSKINERRIKNYALVHITLGFIVFSYVFLKTSATRFFILTNVLRFIELYFAFLVVIYIHKSSRKRYSLDWRSVLIILIFSIVYIILSFDYFDFSIQLLSVARMLQLALISTYLLFNNKINNPLRLWIFGVVLADFLAGLRIVNVLPAEVIFLQHSLQYLTFICFLIGTIQMLKNRDFGFYV